MAQHKKSFVLYTDLIFTLEKLNDSDAGELFKHILRYVNDLSPETKNTLIDIVFEPIKQQLKRDLQHWETIKDKRVIAGAKGGKQKVANASKRVANVAVSVNDTVNVTVTDNVNVINEDKKEPPTFFRVIKHLKLTFEEYDKLIGLGYNPESILNTLDSIENYKKNTNYTSLYLTALKWLKKDNVGKQNFIEKKHDAYLKAKENLGI